MNHKSRNDIYNCIANYFETSIYEAMRIVHFTITSAETLFKMPEEQVWWTIYNSLKTNDEAFVKLLTESFNAINKDADLKSKLDAYIMEKGIESGELKSFKSFPILKKGE